MRKKQIATAADFDDVDKRISGRQSSHRICDTATFAHCPDELWTPDLGVPEKGSILTDKCGCISIST